MSELVDIFLFVLSNIIVIFQIGGRPFQAIILNIMYICLDEIVQTATDLIYFVDTIGFG